MSTKSHKPNLEKLRKKRDDINRQLRETKEKEDAKKNKKFLGKCYVFENSYGTDSSSWNKYFLVTEAGAWLKALSFEKTSTGIFEIESERWFGDPSEHKEISREEFDAAWAKFLEEVNSLNK